MTQLARRAAALTSLAAFVLASAGCASLDESDKGAIIGAAGGAAVGGVIGSKTGSTTRGVPRRSRARSRTPRWSRSAKASR
jgi:hypothetical protein